MSHVRPSVPSVHPNRVHIQLDAQNSITTDSFNFFKKLGLRDVSGAVMSTHFLQPHDVLLLQSIDTKNCTMQSPDMFRVLQPCKGRREATSAYCNIVRNYVPGGGRAFKRKRLTLVDQARPHDIQVRQGVKHKTKQTHSLPPNTAFTAADQDAVDTFIQSQQAPIPDQEPEVEHGDQYLQQLKLDQQAQQQEAARKLNTGPDETELFESLIADSADNLNLVTIEASLEGMITRARQAMLEIQLDNQQPKEKL